MQFKKKLIYLSFVRKAILWEKGVCHKSVHEHPVHRPSLCPRFLSHMKARPEDFQRSRFLNSKSKQQLPSQGNMHILTFPKTQILDGNFHPNPGRGQRGVVRGRCSAVVPGLQLPPTPPPSILSSTPPHHNTPQSDSVSQSKANSIPTSASSRPPLLLPLIVKDRPSERKNEQQPAVMELSSELNLRPAASTCSLTSLSQESNLSRPPSSLFSPSLSSPICSDLTSGRSSVLSNSSTAAAIVNSDPEGSVCVSSPQLSPVMQSPLSSYPPSESDLHRSLKNTSSPPDPPLQEEILSQPRLPSPCSLQDIGSHSDKPRSRGMRAEAAENLDISTDVSHKQSPSSSHGPATLASRSTTWSSSLSPQPTTTRSGSGTKCTPSPSPPVSPLESHRWSVLPPITPPRGHSSASRWSGLSCSQSQLFDDLEAIAPPSTSCLSLDQPSDSSGHPSPDTDLSPGLAALTVGCDSGNLGSLSRVQLLLLDRPVPETVLSPSASDQLFSPVHDWPDLMVQDEDPDLSSAGDLRPCTACSISERCDSAGNKSDWSDCGSGSPSSWIIDLSPTIDMFRSSDSTDRSNYGTPSHNGNPTGEEPNYPARGGQDLLPDGEGRPGSPERRDEEKEQWMEERKTKVLNMLSKLQDNTPVQSKSSQSRSNFEDFDFLAKYCIFSQEKLAEYKRAFEAEDSDGDGYISCLQVLLALKTIIPPELLSDQEEIYVYKILEMVDFRVTDGLVDLRLFAVIASLAEKIASMDEFMRTLISSMDFCSLEVRLFKAKQLFLFLLEEQPDDAGAQQGFISGEQLLLELKAGGIHLEQEAAIRLKLQDIPPFDLLDFLAHLPLFMLIHKSIIANPLDDYTHF